MSSYLWLKMESGEYCMKIVDVKSYVLGTAWRNLTFVRVITDEGLEGVGEVRMVNHTDALSGYLAEAVPRYVIGHDPANVEDLVQRMYRNDYARAGEIAMSAIAVIEIACWDITGQSLGKPVYQLLGGAVRDRSENLAALKKVAEKVSIPVATGERLHTRYDYRTLFELQAADIIQPDITQFGGLLETKKLAAWAEIYYVLVAPHNVGGPVSTAAALHFAASTPNFKIQEHFNDFTESWVKTAAPGNPEVVDGYFALPQGPGLGVKLNLDVVREHPQQRIFFNLFAENWHLRQAPLRSSIQDEQTALPEGSNES